MNILTFNYEYPPLGGGGGVAHALVAEELATRHSVCVITSAYGDLPRAENRNGVEILRVPVLGRTDRATASLVSMLTYPPAACLRAARLLRRRTFDIVHGHFAVPSGPGSLTTAKLARVPHVLSIYGGDIFDPSKRLSPHRLPVVRAVVSAMFAYSDVVVADSTNTRDNAYRYYRYRGPIEIVPLGIRQPSVPAVPRGALGLPDNGLLAVTVGRLVRRKRIDHLLQALSQPGCEPVRLIVVGSGPEQPRLLDLTHQLGIGDRVMFAGQVTEERKWQLLQAADVYVSSTMHEGFGLVYLEAMAAGLPVVTYDEGGQMDFLRHGETGYLVRAGDQAALAATMCYLVTQRALLKEIGASNRRRAPSYSAERCAAAYEGVFERAIAQSRGVRSGDTSVTARTKKERPAF